ncbi:hypothetical protein ABW19_dt0203418 [Dactylella cylindrospora]|nr:hypothetical protein ABW19_dt0203418 [Dactylella cylindrospora]
MKLDTSKPAALSFKVPEVGHEEIRPPLTPATEVDLQKSCAILVQSTTYSKSFRDAAIKTQRAHAKRAGALPVPESPRTRTRTPSRTPNRTPGGTGRVSKGHHRKTSSRVKFEKTVTSEYVPPRRPAPAKALPPARHGKNRLRLDNKDKTQSDTESWEEDVKEVKAPDQTERKSSDARKSMEVKFAENASGEETEKNRKGVKKLVVNMHHAVTGYIRPVDLVSPSGSSAPPLRRKTSVKSTDTSIATVIVATEVDSKTSSKDKKPSSAEVSPIKESAKSEEDNVKVKSSKKKDGVTYVEAIPEHLHAQGQATGSEDERRTSDEKGRSVSRMIGHAVKGYVKPPYVDRFTPEPLSAPKDEAKKETKKHRGVSKAVKDYVKPTPIDPIEANKIQEEPSPTKTEKTPKVKPPTKTPTIEKPKERGSTERPDSGKELKKAVTEPSPKLKSPVSHNPLRLLQDYVKPSMSESALPPIQTNVSTAPTHLSPVSATELERRPLTPQTSLPSMSYVPPKVRPRGKTLPSSDAFSETEAAQNANTSSRSGPIFGGGYPAKQDSANKDKENRGPISPGFFGRNPGGHGFRIHFSHLLHKQRSDGYDQLE